MSGLISLGVDIGGTGAKCVAFREDGRQAAISYLEYPNSAGKTDLDPAVLSEAAFEVIARCVRALPKGEEVAAVTVSSFGESFVPIDEKGRALSSIIMYFADTQSGEFDELVQRWALRPSWISRLPSPTPFIPFQNALHPAHGPAPGVEVSADFGLHLLLPRRGNGH